MRLILVLLSVRLAATFLAWISGQPIAPPSAPLGAATHGFLFVGFGAAGVGLFLGGRHDRRAQDLAGVFIVVALAFAREPLRAVASGIHLPWSALLSFPCDPLLPLFLAMFARDFPRGNRFHLRRSAGIVIAAAAVAACYQLLAAPLGHALSARALNGGRGSGALFILEPRGNAAFTFGLSALALVILVLRSRRAQGLDAVRAQWFVLGLILGLTPITMDVFLAATFQPFRSWGEAADITPALAFVVAGALLTIPVTTAHAVLSRSVLQVSVVFRRATGCAITKYVAVTGSVLPAVLVAVIAVRHRDMTVSDLFGNPSGIALLAAAAIGLGALPFTSAILRLVEQAFFPHAWDQKGAVSRLPVRLAGAANTYAIGDLTRIELTAALGAERIRVAMLDPDARQYLDVDSTEPVCAAQSAMLELLARAEPPVVTLSDAVLRVLERREAAWLGSVATDFVAGMKGSDGRIVGLFAIGPRESELPYSREDGEVAATLARIASDAVERLRYQRTASVAFARNASEPQVLPASECPRCGTVYDDQYQGPCSVCGTSLARACIPALVSGKLKVERRVGKGGMGVVYSAFDLSLQRRVAVKALPYMSEAAEQRLRGEARLMASIPHPNVATVFGMETWNDRPLMVVEYLHGGTLRDRMQGTVSDIATVASWGLSLADGLQYLHRHGLVHGDIKPSNIGFDGQGVPKLLDFGLSRPYAEPDGALAITPLIPFGTPFYTCPEARGAETPRPEFDLWSLALVLYETLAGDTFGKIRRQQSCVPPLSQFRDDVPKTMDEFFVRALSLCPDRRPRSATEFALWLRRARPI